MAQLEIEKYLKKHKEGTAKEIAKEFNKSQSTINVGLKKMCKRGEINKIIKTINGSRVYIYFMK